MATRMVVDLAAGTTVAVLLYQAGALNPDRMVRPLSVWAR